MCDIGRDIGERNVSKRNHRSRSIGYGTSQLSLIDGLSMRKREGQQQHDPNGPSRCESGHSHHTPQKPLCSDLQFLIAIYFV
jgi:hypothetical protein